MQVREAYSKWWKKKKSQSEFLSKMFPTKLSTPAVSQVEHNMLCHITLSAATGIWSTKDEGAETTGECYDHPYLSSPNYEQPYISLPNSNDSRTVAIVPQYLLCTTVELMLL